MRMTPLGIFGVLAASACLAGLTWSERTASAATLKPISVSGGCKQGRKFVVQAARRKDWLDWNVTNCYRRDKYRVVVGFWIVDDDNSFCRMVGIVSSSSWYWNWRQYATYCR